MEWNVTTIIVTVVGGFAVVAVLMLALIPLRRRMHANQGRRAVLAFRLQREMLEAKFYDIASTLGKPRGLRWIDCDWENNVTFARDRETGLLTAFVAVNIRFEAIEGGDMEDVAAVDTVRDAAALFHFQNSRWGTGGKALFNLNPDEALIRLENQFEPLAPMT